MHVLRFADLIGVPKTVERVGVATFKAQVAHVELAADIAAAVPGRIVLYARINRERPENVSVGLRYESDALEEFTFARANGDHGTHENPDGTVVRESHLHLPPPAALGDPVRYLRRLRWAEQMTYPPTLPDAWGTFADRLSIAPDRKLEKALRGLQHKYGQLRM